MVLYGYSAGGMKAFDIGAFEHMGSLLMNHFNAQMQKGAVNMNGGFIGAGLHKAIEQKAYETRASDPSLLESSRYLNLNEDFRDRIAVWSDPAYSADVSGGAIHLTSLDESYQGCDIEAILDTGHGFAGGLKANFKSVSLKQGQATRLPLMVDGVQGARVFLDHCEVIGQKGP
jgi:hypothetical protein